MKRCPIGAVLLLILLVLGLLSSGWMNSFHSERARDVALAADAALRQDWDTAEAHTGHAKQKWESCRGLAASISNDTPIEEIDGLFRQLEVHAAGKDALTYASICMQLSHHLQSLGESHRLSWQNLL